MSIHLHSPLRSCALFVLMPLLCAGLSSPGHAHADTMSPLSQDGSAGAPRSNGTIVAMPGKFELGDIQPGSEHSRTFELRNVSKQSVRVLTATPTCRCTTTNDIAGVEIPPGGMLPFTAVLAAPTTPGNKNAKVQITFSGNLSPLVVELEGDITMAIKADPPYVGGPKGKQPAGTLVVRSVDGKPFSILESGGRAPVFVGFDPSTQAPRSEYTLRWNIAWVDDLPRHIWWVVFTDHSECPVLPLRIRNDATGSRSDLERFERHWRFDETILNAESLPSGRPVSLELVLKHYNPRARGAVQQPQWGVVKSMRSLSGDLKVGYTSTTVLSKEDVKVLFTVTPTGTHRGPIYDLIEVETTTGKGTFGLLAVVGAPPRD